MKNFSRTLCVGLIAFSILSCKSGIKKSVDSINSEFGHEELDGSYLYVGRGDTIRLALTNMNDSLTGELVYQLKEKDKNEGTFSGIILDSLLVGSYSFQSEGTLSVREVVFRIIPEGLIEGYGELEDQNGEMVFKNIKELSFDHGMILKKE